MSSPTPPQQANNTARRIDSTSQSPPQSNQPRPTRDRTEAQSNTNIPSIPTRVVNRLEETNETSQPSPDQITIYQHSLEFKNLIGQSPTHSILLSTSTTSDRGVYHEACVYLPQGDKLWMTSFTSPTTATEYPTGFWFAIALGRTNLDNGENHVHRVRWLMSPHPPGIVPDGVVSYKDGILFSIRRLAPGNGGIFYTAPQKPAKNLVKDFAGMALQMVSDVVVAKKDGCIWFPEMGLPSTSTYSAKLRSHVYRYDPETDDLTVVVDGLDKPCGLAFSPDESILYVTDINNQPGGIRQQRGVRQQGEHRNQEGDRFQLMPGYVFPWLKEAGLAQDMASTIFAFDVIRGSLANKRPFASVALSHAMGIKCDIHGNVYAAIGSGIEVWDQNGTLIGKIVVPGRVRNFCFGRDGEVFICSREKLWRLQLARETMGALMEN